MTNEIKAIVFDIGGVLVENPKYHEFWNEKEGSEELRTLFGEGKISKEDFIQRGAELLNLSPEKFYEKYTLFYWTGNLIKPVFETYKRIEVKKYLFSDTNPIHQEYLKKNFKELFDLADGVFLNKRKAHLSSFENILEAINQKPNEVVFIDDKEKYVENAQKKGAKAILFKNSSQLIEELKKLGVRGV